MLRTSQYVPIYNAAGKIGPGAKENVDDEAYSLALAKAHAEGRHLTAAERDQLKQQTTARPAKGRGKKNKSE